MKRPNPKEFNARQFSNGTYEDDLEKYIDYLEKSFQSIDVVQLQKIRKDLLEQIDESDCFPEDQTDWTVQIGILLSAKDSKFILQIIDLLTQTKP